MAMNTETIRTLRIKAVTEGLEAAAQGLQNLEKEMGGVRVVSETTSSATESVGKAWDRALNRVDPLRKSLSDLEKAQALANRALATGAGTQEESAKYLAVYEQNVLKAAAGTEKLAGAHGGIDSATQAAMHAMRGFTEQVALGISPLQALTSEASRLSYVMSQPGGLAGAFGGIGQKLISAFTSPYAAVVALGAAVIGGVAAATSYANAQKDVALQLSTTGRAAGATAGDIQTIAEQMAQTGRISVSAARDIAVELAKTGQIGKDSFVGIGAQVETFAKATGQDMPAAAKALAQAFADPAKGAEQLAAQIGGIDAKTLQYIRTLASQGDKLGAQKALQDALRQALAQTDQQLQNSISYWERFKNAVSGAVDGIGKSLSGGSLQDRLADLQGKRDFQAQNYGDTAAGQRRIAQLDAQIAKTQEAIAAQNKLNDATAKQAQIATASDKADAITRGIFSEIGAYEQLQQKISDLKAATDGLSESQMRNAAQAKAALEIVAAANYGQNGKFKDDPVAAQSFRLTQDYQNQIAAIRAVSVEEKASAAAAIARTAAERDLSTALNAGQLADQARGLAVAQAAAQMQQMLTAQQGQIQLAQTELATLGMDAAQRDRLLAGLRAEIQLRDQGRDVTDASSKAYIENAKALADLQTAQKDEQEAEAKQAQQYQDAISGSKSYAQVVQDELNGVSHLTQAQMDNVAAMDRQRQATERAKDALAEYNAMLQQAINDAAKASAVAPFSPDSVVDLYMKSGTLVSKNLGGPGSITDANGNATNSISAMMDPILNSLAARGINAKDYMDSPYRMTTPGGVVGGFGGSPVGSGAANAIASPLNALIQSALSALNSAGGSAGGAAGSGTDPNGSKTAPKLDAYAERNASIYYGTESGNYYSDAIQKQQSTSEAILSTNQDQLATAQAQYDALMKIADLANQMYANGAFANDIAKAVADGLSKIGLQQSAQSVLQAMQLPTGADPNKPFGNVAIDNFQAPVTTTAPTTSGASFAGMFAAGGEIPAGSVGVAGEAGPEIIKGPATVIPSSRLAGNDNRPIVHNVYNITQNITTNDGKRVMRGIESVASQNVDMRRAMGGAANS